nr:MAG TPA: hypothetical protein [Caudoviricetes sp.]
MSSILSLYFSISITSYPIFIIIPHFEKKVNSF